MLAARGILRASEARNFLRLEAGPLPDTSLLPDLALGIERIRAAIARGELIAIYGDYDVDGLTATAMLAEGFRGLGARAMTHIPNRFSDGYGVSSAALQRLQQAGAGLVITVDCGISAIVEIDAAREQGLDVIVLDHHEVQGSLPAAIAAIDPKREDSRYPTRELCSGGLALRLIEALYSAFAEPTEEKARARLFELAALATVCDMVPLDGENREIVKAGLPALAATHRPGLRALLQVSGATGEPVTTDTLGFRIGPRLNAAGRLGDPSEALELLMTSDVDRAAVLAQRLDALNRQRQELVEAAALRAESLVQQEPEDSPLLLIGDASISRGIVGLVASRLVDLHRRPAFVYELGEAACVGSARGVPGFDVVRALASASDLLSRHGGHKAAGGFSVPPQNLGALRERLFEAAREQAVELASAGALEIDAETSLSELNTQTLRALWRFAPCGIGNPAPLLLSRGVRVVSRWLVGAGKHLQLRLRDGAATWHAIAFNRAADAPPPDSHIDIVYAVDAGRGQYGPRLRIVDFRLTQDEGVAE